MTELLPLFPYSAFTDMKLAYDTYEPDINSTCRNPIVLLHSMFECRRSWKLISPDIAKRTGRKVYAVDSRNHGESPWSDRYDCEVMTDDLEEFLNYHGLDKIVLIGHSMGGKVAMTFALRRPEMIEMLIIEDATARNLNPQPGSLLELAFSMGKDILDTMKEFGNKKQAEEFSKGIVKNFAEMFRITGEFVDNFDFDLLPLKWNGQYYEVQLNLNALEKSITLDTFQNVLSGVFEGNVLLIYGESSQFKVFKDNLVDKFFPRVVKVGLEGAGHFIHSTFPEAFLKEVCNFINSRTELKCKY